MDKMRRFIKTAGVYLIGNVLSKIVGFFLLPLYTNRLSPDQFGEYDLIVTLITFLIPIIFFQIWDGMFRFAFDKSKLTEKYEVISNSFLFFALGFVIYLLIFWILFIEFQFKYAVLIFFYGLLFAMQYQYTFIARAFLKNWLFVISGLINTTLTAIINIILILKFNIGIESLYIAHIIGCAAQILLIEIVIQPLKYFNLHNVKAYKIIDMLKFSVPLCIATVSYWLLSGYTKVAISQQLGTYENGLYAVANKFSSMITLVVSVFQFAWNEMAYSIAKDDNRVITYEKGVQYIFKVIMLGSGVFMLLIKIIFPYLIGFNYSGALALVPLSIIGISANSFAGFISTIFMTEKQTRWIFWTTIIASFINVVCTWIFIPFWGLQGAIGALCLAFIVLAFIRAYVVGNIFSIKFPWSNLIYILILALNIYLFFVVDNILWLILIIIMLCCILVYDLRDILLVLWQSVTNKRR